MKDLITIEVTEDVREFSTRLHFRVDHLDFERLGAHIIPEIFSEVKRRVAEEWVERHGAALLEAISADQVTELVKADLVKRIFK